MLYIEVLRKNLAKLQKPVSTIYTAVTWHFLSSCAPQSTSRSKEADL